MLVNVVVVKRDIDYNVSFIKFLDELYGILRTFFPPGKKLGPFFWLCSDAPMNLLLHPEN